jgi:hypothetical protein
VLLRDRVANPRFRRLAAVGPLCIAAACATVGVWTTTACTTHQCDTGPPIVVQTDMSSIHVDGDQVVWESARLEGPWGEFLGNRRYLFPFPMRFCPTDALPYVSLDRDPQPRFILAAGQAAELSYLTPDGVTVSNLTCQPYFLRLVVHGTLLPGDCPAQTSSDSSIQDGNESEPQDGGVGGD